jgi:hypothetical protein
METTLATAVLAVDPIRPSSEQNRTESIELVECFMAAMNTSRHCAPDVGLGLRRVTVCRDW